MPDRRPRPLNLRTAPKRKTRPGNKAPRRPRSAAEKSTAVYWIAGVLLFLLVALIVIGAELPVLQTWIGEIANPPQPEIPTPTPSAPSAEDERLKKLQAQAEAETRKAEERSAPKPVATPAPVITPAPVLHRPAPIILSAPTPVPMPAPAATTEIRPPVAQPVTSPATNAAPARALPLDPNKLDTERIAAYQVALERIHFSCGFIDGDQGMRTQRMLKAYQTSRGLPVTGFLDQPTRDAIGEPGEPFLSYTVTAADMATITPKLSTWRAKSQAKYLGYTSTWEMLAEKFHCTRAYLKALNPGVPDPVEGTEVIGPKVFPAAPIPKAASLRIFLSETSIEALDANNTIIGFFPCSIAKDKDKRPHGLLTVKVVDPHPDYTFDPTLFADAALAEGINHKMMIPPGPRNPVGTTWVGLSLPGYGIHGTPEPENISRTQSHGCFRLANWNAEKVIKMVKIGTPVDVEP